MTVTTLSPRTFRVRTKLYDLSIVIANWNTADYLMACLESLRSVRKEGVNFEIIVVDDASSDDSAQRVRRLFPEVKVIVNETNKGYAAAVNRGAAIATGRYLLLLNPDTRLTPESILSLLFFADRHPEAGAVAPRLLYPDGTPQPSVRRFPTPFNLIAFLFASVTGRRVGNRYLLDAQSIRSPREVDQPMSSALLIRCEAWEEVGGMDESFPLFFNDVDLCWRLKRKGWKIYYHADAVVWHYHGASTSRLHHARLILSTRGLLRFYDKNVRQTLPLPLYLVLRSSVAAFLYARHSLLLIRNAGRSRKG